jgi:exopolysaccharide production protein ExoY
MMKPPTKVTVTTTTHCDREALSRHSEPSSGASPDTFAQAGRAGEGDTLLLRMSPRRTVDAWLLGLGLCAVPASIALAEFLLVTALLFRIIALCRHREALFLPRAFWFWLVWAALELFAWARSPERSAGNGEIRHLLLVGSVFLLVPALDYITDYVAVWRGIVVVATISSVVLIEHFFSRLFYYRGNLDPIVYLRGGGLLHHWMVYGTVEILVFVGLLELWRFYPEERWWLLPVFAINVVAILVSLTRMLWFVSLLILALHFVWSRSRWIWAVPVIPCILFVSAPGAVRNRVTDSMHPSYYSNAERLQMLRVGWKMVRQNPLTGIGPGRVKEIYTEYLSAADPVPAFHGHLHNNLVQLAAEFGLPVIGAALTFVMVLLHDLRKRCKYAFDRNRQFLCCTSLLGLTGFAAAGMFDYTYGHSLGLILLVFMVLAPLVPAKEDKPLRAFRTAETMLVRRHALEIVDRVLSFVLLAVLSPLIMATGALVYAFSRRSPFIAHLRVGQNGQPLWIWKVRTMWSKEPPSHLERGWLQWIKADPAGDTKLKHDPRVTNRFAAFCRRHSIDELPQLLQVVLGEMSLVGPRPVTQAELTRHYGARAVEILTVKPGLTGYWQTQGRNRLSYQNGVQLDLELIKDSSMSAYCQVLLRTIPEVLNGKSAW